MSLFGIFITYGKGHWSKSHLLFCNDIVAVAVFLKVKDVTGNTVKRCYVTPCN
jgi:hypothetical protein